VGLIPTWGGGEFKAEVKSGVKGKRNLKKKRRKGGDKSSRTGGGGQAGECFGEKRGRTEQQQLWRGTLGRLQGEEMGGEMNEPPKTSKKCPPQKTGLLKGDKK